MPMTAPDSKTTIDPRIQAAWVAYRDQLRDLEGSEYARVEAEAWEQLQAELFTLTDELEDEHSSISS